MRECAYFVKRAGQTVSVHWLIMLILRCAETRGAKSTARETMESMLSEYETCSRSLEREKKQRSRFYREE